MRYEAIAQSLFIKNRKKLSERINANGIAILCSNEVIPTNADGIMGFKQNSDLFYLSGIDQEETFLVISPDYPDKKNREILFIRETNEHLKIWEGEKLSKQQAREISGIETIYWSHQLEAVLKRMLCEAEFLYLNSNEHDGRNVDFVDKSQLFNSELEKKYPLHKTERLTPLLSDLRMIKEPEEIKQIEKALEITKKGFLKIASKLRPDRYEFELEACLTHEFLLNRSRGHAFPPILASGKNSCVLHYVTNNERCIDGELILMDFGAEYANYNADITRVLPVNGRFSARQKEVYQAVLNIFHFAKSLLIPGNTMELLKIEVGKKVEQELIQLGLLSQKDIENQNPEQPLYRKYFPHSVSHSLGLDVHDTGSRFATFKPGMVLTCEPGIYIPDERIGIRLENDILLTETGNYDLCENIPLEIEAIEALFN
jgi:Xaa-Pro aminopeptidase